MSKYLFAGMFVLVTAGAVVAVDAGFSPEIVFGASLLAMTVPVVWGAVMKGIQTVRATTR